jgi:hypothetical protein
MLGGERAAAEVAVGEAAATEDGSGEGAVAARLAAPARTLGPAALAAAWFHGLVRVRCARAGGLAGDPALLGKLRGALGHELGRAGSAEALAGRPCPWRPPCALDLLFRTQGRITGGLEIPKPWVPAAEAEGDDLVVVLTIMGFATEWLEPAAEALVRGLRGGLSGTGRLEVVDREILVRERVEPPAGDHLLLLWRTPLEIRRSEPARPLDPPTIVASLANRVSGLARFQDAALAAGAARELKAAAGRVRARWLEARAVAWSRWSGRQGRRIPMAGVTSALELEGELGPLLPLLAIGETCHVGSHATLGLGRYVIALPAGRGDPTPA